MITYFDGQYDFVSWDELDNGVAAHLCRGTEEAQRALVYSAPTGMPLALSESLFMHPTPIDTMKTDVMYMMMAEGYGAKSD